MNRDQTNWAYCRTQLPREILKEIGWQEYYDNLQRPYSPEQLAEARNGVIKTDQSGTKESNKEFL
jgi:hypothetical protein